MTEPLDTGVEPDAWRRQAAAHRAAAAAEEPVRPAPAPAPAPVPAPVPATTAAAPAAETWGSGPDPVTDELPRPPRPPRRAGAPAAEGGSGGRGSGGHGRALLGAGLALGGVSLSIALLLWLNGGGDRTQTAALTRTAGTSTTSTTPAAGAAGSAPSSSLAAGSASGSASGSSATPASPPAPAVPSAPAATAPPPEPAVTNPAPGPVAVQAAARPPVTVLNNSRVRGLGDRAAARFRAAGWPVADVGNLRGRLRASTVYYAPGQQAAAQRFARQFGVARVLPRLRGLPGRGLTVVLTRHDA